MPISDIHESQGPRHRVHRSRRSRWPGPIRIVAAGPAPGRDDARVGEWTVAERPAGAPHVYTWPVQGFSLRAAAARVRLEGRS